MNCLYRLLKTYNRIIYDDFDNILESAVYRITKDFSTTDPEINENITQLVKILKKNIKQKYSSYFPHKIMISLLDKTDTWNIIDHNGRYIVAANFVEDNKCQKRYLIKVSCNNIKLVDEMLINKDVNPKNIIS
mgnify:CR=1 FL=1